MNKKLAKKTLTKTHSITAKPTKKTIPLFDYSKFKAENTGRIFMVALVLSTLFLFGLFKNISYPLFWADESATVIGSARVLQFGYPKVHDGKNVFYDLRHSDPQLGIDKKTDAYIGGSGWGQFYYGTLGYKLSEVSTDMYTRTGIFRTTFAIAGLAGILFVLWFVCKFFKDRFSMYSFIALFILLELCSVSLLLVLKQVRYYSPSLLLLSLIIGGYSLHRFYKPLNISVLIPALVIPLWLLFNTFAPVYFIVLLTLAISELIIAIIKFVQTNLKETAKTIFPIALSLVISVITVSPLIIYLRTFEIADAMATFNGYGHEMYLYNLNAVINYFEDFDFLWLAVALKVLTFLNIRKFISTNNALFKLSNFLTLFFIVYVFAIARIPNFTFTRYFIPAQPFFTATILIDLFLLINLFSLKSTQFVSAKIFFTITMFTLFVVIGFVRNLENMKGYAHELFEQYKGPLDYTIPYIKDHYKKTDNLTIATNYEETSFMYYLKSKVIMGFVGNNLAKDSLLVPDIIVYRKPWGNFAGIFEKFVQRANYKLVRFPVKDLTCNDIPELNFPTPYFNHQFYTPLPENERDSTQLFYR